MTELMDEIEQEIEELEGDERLEAEQSLEVAKDLAYLVEEGFIGMVEDPDGELRFYPL